VNSGLHTPQKLVRAKVTAYVDEGIKQSVEILNTFDGLWTDEICQGYAGEMIEISLHYVSMFARRY